MPLDGQVRMGYPIADPTPVVLQLIGQDPRGPEATYYFEPSTQKVKSNIKPSNQDILEGFDKLNPVTFNYINSPKILEGGFIAEEVAEAHPSFADWRPNYHLQGGHLYVNKPPLDNTLVPLDISERGIMAAAVKKLQHLENELNKLNG